MTERDDADEAKAAPPTEPGAAPVMEAPAAPSVESSEPELSVDDPFIGRIVADKYRIVGKLGAGGMAVVYEAENVTIKKRVALKLVDPSQPRGAELAARFAREVEASAKVEHPHVVAAFDGGTLPSGEAFLVTQLVRGDSLHERLDAGPLPWKEAVVIATQIADALSAIHAAGFVHRDLTPSNVLLSSGRSGTHAFVLDLGIAAPIDRGEAAPVTSSFRTTTGTSVGTPGYMSPEQALGKKVDARSDLYVLGLLFFEMLTAKPVIDGDLALTSIVTRQLQEELQLPSLGETRLPPALDTMARELVRSDPARRPASADAVRWAFSSWATGQAPETPAARPSLEIARAAGEKVAGGVRDAWTRAKPTLRARAEALREGALDLVDRAKRRALRPRDWATIGGVLAMVCLSCVVFGYGCSGSDESAVATVAEAPETPATSPTTEAADAGAAPSEPGEITVTLSEAENDLLHGRTRSVRETAAGTILSAEDGTYPRYARLASVLTLARTCEARLTQIEALAALGDLRAIPALERIDEAPTTGCGRRSREDCYACARDAVAAALASLRATGGIAP